MVRSFLLRFENLNSVKFSPFLMSVNKPTLAEHIRHLSVPQTWGTQIELLAVATYYKIPVYYVNKKSGEDNFKWNIIKPLCAENMTYPELCEEDSLIASTEATHIELMHSSSHYDSITTLDTEKVSRLMPVTECDDYFKSRH